MIYQTRIIMQNTLIKTAEVSESLLYALRQNNLVYNGDFRYFSNRTAATYGVPDGWMYSHSGAKGSIDFDPDTNQCVLIKDEKGSLLSFKQHLQEFPRWQQLLIDHHIIAKVHLSIDNTSEVSVVLSDGITENRVTKKGPGTMEYEVLIRVNSQASFVSIAIETTADIVTIGISTIYANRGSIAIPHLPCIIQGVIGERKQYIATESAPLGEFSICEPSEELGASYTRLNTVLNGRYGTGANGRSLLPDIRGYFSRAWDNRAMTDPNANDRLSWGDSTISGDHVSTRQEDVFLTHSHELEFSIDTPTIIAQQGVATPIVNTIKPSTTQPIGGDETRPKNITELYTIKWA